MVKQVREEEPRSHTVRQKDGQTLHGGCRARLLYREEGAVDVHHASEMDRLRRWLEASAGERQDLSRSIRIYLLCSYLHLLLLSLHLRGLTISSVHTNRAAEEIPTLDYSTNPALYDGEPLRHCHQAHVGEGLASIQAWTDSRPGSRCLYAFHLFVGASGRVFRVQYAQRLRPWIAV